MYIIKLEKTGGEYSGVSSAKLNHFGVTAKLTKFDKYSSPCRNSPVRLLGEAEVRLITAAAGADVVSDILNQSNDPITHKEVLSSIYSAEKPTFIERVIDRHNYPKDKGRNILFINHVLECAGTRFVYKPETD
jgi:hypothetical protein